MEEFVDAAESHRIRERVACSRRWKVRRCSREFLAAASEGSLPSPQQRVHRHSREPLAAASGFVAVAPEDPSLHQRTRRHNRELVVASARGLVAAPVDSSLHQRFRRGTRGSVAAPEDSSPRLWFRRRNAPEDSAAPERLVKTSEGSKLHQRTRALLRQIRVCRSHQRTHHRI